MVRCISHALMKKGGLQPASAHLRHSSCTGEQSDSVMDGKDAGGAWLAVDLGKKTHTMIASGGNSAESCHKVQQFRVLVRPALGADFRPDLRFLRTSNSRLDIAGQAGQRLLHRAVQD